eukprot:75547_1
MGRKQRIQPVPNRLQNRKAKKKDPPSLTSLLEFSTQIDDFLVEAAIARGGGDAESAHILRVGNGARAEWISEKSFEELPDSHTYTHLPIPRRPPPPRTMAKLEERERSAFSKWRRKIARLAEESGRVVTPFEKNIEVWRQLWRVIERSHVVMQIVDARNPPLFRCRDLEASAAEKGAPVVFVLNKADLLSARMRREWAEYLVRKFRKEAEEKTDSTSAPSDNSELDQKSPLENETAPNVSSDQNASNQPAIKPSIHFVFFSALDEHRRLDLVSKSKREHQPNQRSSDSESSQESAEDGQTISHETLSSTFADISDSESSDSSTLGPLSTDQTPVITNDSSVSSKNVHFESHPFIESVSEIMPASNESKPDIESASANVRLQPIAGKQPLTGLELQEYCRVLNTRELLQFCEDVAVKHYGRDLPEPAPHQNQSPGQPPRWVFGTVGHPNVGKSSLINALCGRKRTATGATPGKTKHFQTLHVGARAVLCDCPGLVFPTLVSSKADLVCHGIIPVDTLTNENIVKALRLICARVPARKMRAQYSCLRSVDVDEEHEDGASRLTVEQLIGAVAKSRGFLTKGGHPNVSKTGRLILKDFVGGRISYCHPTPNSQEE